MSRSTWNWPYHLLTVLISAKGARYHLYLLYPVLSLRSMYSRTVNMPKQKIQ